MRFIATHISRYDWLLMGSVLLLVAFGLLTLFSLSRVSLSPLFERQLLWFLAGIFLLAAVSFIDIRIFRTQKTVVLCLYIISILALFGVLAGSAPIRGINAWFRIGSVLLQPVELAKLSLVVLLAKYFSKRHIEIYRMRHVIVSGIYMGIPALLVSIQPDIGSAIILIAIWMIVILFSGMKLRHFFMLAFVFAVVAAIAWGYALAPYQKERITAFVNPYDDPQGAGYQMIQSVIAVGSGKIFGKGLGYGSQSHLNFLPEAETDFIFATFAEEWGLFGSLSILLLILILLWRVIIIGIRAGDNFSQIFTLGFAAYIFSQSVIHIGMSLGLLPVTGITLPFVSYGGSSLVMLMIGIGIVQNIRINTRRVVE